MHKLKLKTDGSVIAAIKQSILVIALLFIILPIFIFWDGVTAIPELNEILYDMLIVGIFLLLNYSILIFLLSRYSPVKILKIRKQIINFTRLFLKSETDGLLIHSVKWMYGIKGRKTIIDLYFNGLVKDSVEIGQKLSEYLAEVSTSVYEISNITAEKPLKIRCFQLFIIFDNVVPLYYLYF